MNYLVSMITNDNVEARRNDNYSDLNNAIMAFHQEAASAYANDKVTKALIKVEDENGNTIRQEMK